MCSGRKRLFMSWNSIDFVSSFMLVLLNGTCEILFIFAIVASYFKIFIIIYIHHILLRLIKLILDWSLWILYASVSLLEMQNSTELEKQKIVTISKYSKLIFAVCIILQRRVLRTSRYLICRRPKIIIWCLKRNSNRKCSDMKLIVVLNCLNVSESNPRLDARMNFRYIDVMIFFVDLQWTMC